MTKLPTYFPADSTPSMFANREMKLRVRRDNLAHQINAARAEMERMMNEYRQIGDALEEQRAAS